VRNVGAEDAVEVTPVQDQDPVEALAAERPDPPLGVGVRVRRPNRCADDPDALATEHRVEVTTELAITIVEQKPEPTLSVVELHHEVGRAGDELDPAPLDRHEEQHVDARQQDLLDGQKVAREHRGCVLAKEPSPAETVSGAGSRPWRIRIARIELDETATPRPASSPMIRL
jgi:hypothetical protein